MKCMYIWFFFTEILETLKWDFVAVDTCKYLQWIRVTPPVKRKPCLGRNINDSDADLYAEYHGNGDSSDQEEADLPRPRLRAPRQQISSQTPSLQGKKLFQNQPDLLGTIHTNFSQTPPSPVNHTSFISLDPPSMIKSSESSPLPSSSSSWSDRDSTSGFNFQSWFQPLYDEHAQFLRDNPMVANDVISDSRSRSWSAGMGS